MEIRKSIQEVHKKFNNFKTLPDSMNYVVNKKNLEYLLNANGIDKKTSYVFLDRIFNEDSKHLDRMSRINFDEKYKYYLDLTKKNQQSLNKLSSYISKNQTNSTNNINTNRSKKEIIKCNSSFDTLLNQKNINNITSNNINHNLSKLKKEINTMNSLNPNINNNVIQTNNKFKSLLIDIDANYFNPATSESLSDKIKNKENDFIILPSNNIQYHPINEYKKQSYNFSSNNIPPDSNRINTHINTNLNLNNYLTINNNSLTSKNINRNKNSSIEKMDKPPKYSDNKTLFFNSKVNNVANSTKNIYNIDKSNYSTSANSSNKISYKYVNKYYLHNNKANESKQNNNKNQHIIPVPASFIQKRNKNSIEQYEKKFANEINKIKLNQQLTDFRNYKQGSKYVNQFLTVNKGSNLSANRNNYSSNANKYNSLCSISKEKSIYTITPNKSSKVEESFGGIDLKKNSNLVNSGGVKSYNMYPNDFFRLSKPQVNNFMSENKKDKFLNVMEKDGGVKGKECGCKNENNKNDGCCNNNCVNESYDSIAKDVSNLKVLDNVKNYNNDNNNYIINKAGINNNTSLFDENEFNIDKEFE